MRRPLIVPVLADSVTAVPAGAGGAVLVSGSHGGLYPAACALRLRVAAAVFSDAGFGLADAGVAGLELLERHGVAAAAVSHKSARIGDARDLLARGRISAANRIARACGLEPGQRLEGVWQRLAQAPGAPPAAAPRLEEGRHVLAAACGPRVSMLDSNAMVGQDDVGAIVLTGSHGGLPGGRPASAIRQAVFAAFYNDAGVGIDAAGIGRLPALDARGIAGIAVDAFSARIGDGLSTYHDGVASHVNTTAAAHGARAGMKASAIVEVLREAWCKQYP